MFFFFKQKTAYEMRISDWSSDVCSSDLPLAIITGVGPGTGAALARRFHAGGYRVAMLARDASRLGALAEELPGSIAIGCDVGDPAALAQALDRAAAEGGDPKVLIHNAVGGAIGSFLDVEPSVLEARSDEHTSELQS